MARHVGRGPRKSAERGRHRGGPAEQGGDRCGRHRQRAGLTRRDATGGWEGKMDTEVTVGYIYIYIFNYIYIFRYGYF